MSLATLIVRAAFGSLPMATPSWTDITAYVREVQIRRGRQNEFERVETGTATIILSNADRRFDPTFTTGAYYLDIWPMVRINIQGRWTSGGLTVDYDLYTGFAESWEPEWPGKKDAICTLECTDGLKILNMAQLNTAYDIETSDVRVNHVLDDIGWTNGASGILDSATNGQLDSTFILAPNGDREIHGGHINVQAVTLDNTSALMHIDNIRESENGNYYIDKSGTFVFHNAHTPFHSPYDVSQATFGDGGGSEIGYYDVLPSFDDQRIYNDIRCNRTDGTQQTATDATSKTKYTLRTLSKTGLANTTDDEVLTLAQWLLAHYKDLTLYGAVPLLRIEQLIVKPQSDDNAWPHVLGRELDDRITVKRRSTVAETITVDCVIASIQHNITPDTWVTRWGVYPADTGIYLTLDHPVYGALDTARLLY